MHCPSCGKTFDPATAACPDCGVGLVETPPGLPPDPTIRLTSVFRTGDPALIALAKSLLDSEGIEYLVRSEGVQDLFGGGRIGAGFNIVTGPAEFVVREDDVEKARELFRDLEASTSTDDGQSEA